MMTSATKLKECRIVTFKKLGSLGKAKGKSTYEITGNIVTDKKTSTL